MTNPLQELLCAAFPAERLADLDRIIVRAQAEVEYTLLTIGIGAPSTLKRARAVRMALDGASVEETSLKTGLPPARIERIVENVLNVGFQALYPSFVETVDLPGDMTQGQLWALVSPVLETTPASHGVRTAVWNPLLLVDFLVFTGSLPDASASQFADVIKRHLDPEKKPVTFEFEDSTRAHDGPVNHYLTAGLFLGSAIIFCICIANRSIAGSLFLGLATLFFGSNLLKNLLEARLLRRVIAKKSKADGAAAVTTQPAPPAHMKGPLAPPKFTILHALSLPPTPWQIDRISDASNALGLPPMRVLYLWVFAAQNNQGGFETEGWPQLGSVHLLLNATALSIGRLVSAAKKLLVSTPEVLDRTIGGYNDQAGTYDRPSLFIDGSVGKRRYRGYPIHTLVCNDTVWKPAVAQLAGRCDLAVVNLSGYNPNHPGLEYEIHHLLSGGPPDRFVFIYERSTDADAVISSVLSLWSHLETPSAKVPELIFMRVPDSQEVGYGSQFQKAPTGLGWLAKTLEEREGEYVPIAPRIVAYLNSRSVDGTAS